MHRRTAAIFLPAALLAAGCAGGPLAPGCERETGTVFETHSTVAAGGSAGYEVASPRHSNLIMTLTWTDPGAALALRATIIGCGEHTGCQIGLTTPAVPAGPEGLRLLVDGTRGKRYAVDVVGDAAREQSFTLRVTFDTGTCT
ncbi:MAG TPA: hypothetical protein VHI98_09195 [Vicinamibacterales bacterium]|jgi:hypothetical protein|nr:hypothetical protein [Vicinamibacterales bacterium]